MTAAAVNVVAVTQSDPFFLGPFFRAFLGESRGTRVNLVEIVVLPNFNESRAALLRRLWRFYGPVGVVRLVARYIWASAAERAGRRRSVEGVAARHGVPVRHLATVNDEAYLHTLRERGVDVLLSVAAPQIFRSEALAAAPTVLNVHNGRLPAYRGMMPTFWALAAGDREVVVTVHEMAERLDAGRVIAEFPVPVDAASESAFEVSRRAKDVAGREVARLLHALGTQDWPQGHAIDVSAGAYHGFPTREDVRRLRDAGGRLL
jgi:methionyl-tRNA formyltransferase